MVVYVSATGVTFIIFMWNSLLSCNWYKQLQRCCLCDLPWPTRAWFVNLLSLLWTSPGFQQHVQRP